MFGSGVDWIHNSTSHGLARLTIPIHGLHGCGLRMDRTNVDWLVVDCAGVDWEVVDCMWIVRAWIGLAWIERGLGSVDWARVDWVWIGYGLSVD